MAQYTEGQRLKGSDGNLYVVRNGVPVRDAPSPLIQKPTAQFEAPQAQANLQRTRQEIQQAEATAAANTTKTKNEAVKSGIDVKTAQADLDMKLGTAPGDLSKSGAAYIATLPQGIGDLTREMLSGNYKGSITSSRNPVVMQAALAAAHATNGNFDAGRYDERVALMKGITNPNSQLGALNTAIAHAGMLYDQAPKVAGTSFFGDNVLSTGANAISNWFHSGSPGITQYQSILQKYGPESARAYGVNTGGEREAAQAPLSINLPLDAKQASLKTDMELFAGKIASLAHQNDILGGNHPIDYLSPEAKAALMKIDPQGYDKFVAATGGNQAPARAGNETPQGFGFTPPPTGPTGGIGPSTNGFSETPDPQSADFWASAAQRQIPYRTALKQWQEDAKVRGLVGITPPPPGAYHKAAAYIRDNPNVPYQPFSSVTREPTDPLQQATTDAAFSGPGVAVGHAANSLAGTLPTALAGDQGARYNAVSNATHPNYAFAGDLAGTVGGALTAGKFVKGIAPNLGRFGSLLTTTPARTAFTGDLLYGGTAGAAQNPDHPFLGATEGAAAMAAGNVAGRYLLAPAIRGGAKAFNKVGGMFGAAPLDIPTPLSAGENLLFNRSNSAGADVRANLQDASSFGLPYSLADANPQLRALAGSAVRKSPDVRALAENTIGPRQLGQGERAIGLVDNLLAPVGDVSAMKADALSRAQIAARPLYEKAMTHPTPNDPAIMEMLDTPAGQAAARNAYSIALNSGESPAELSFSTGPNGEPILNGLPNWKTLQYVKMGLDKVVTDNTNQVTGKLDLSDPANRALNNLRARFVGRLGEINPDYRAANDAYGKIAGQGAAAERGAAATSSKVTPEQAQIAVGNAGENLPHFQRGYASNLADQVERSRLSGDPYNLIYGSMGQQSKLGTVFPQGAANFGRARALEGDMSKTAFETLGGSPTAARIESDKLFENPLADAGVELGIMAATGVPPKNLILSGLRKFSDSRNLGFRGAKAKADQIGPMLLNSDPTAAMSTLDQLQRLALLRNGYVNQTRAIGGMFGAPLFGGSLIYGANQ
jgi:hypothetical protein